MLLFIVGMMASCSNVYSAEEELSNGGYQSRHPGSEKCERTKARSVYDRNREIGKAQAGRIGNIHSYENEGKILSLIFKENVYDVFEMSSEVKM